MRTDRRALVVGISKYEILKPLKYALHDAEIISAQLSEYNCQFSCKTLLGEEATAKEIRNNFKSLFVGADDDAIIIFFFAGHAVNQDSGTFLVTLDSEDDIESGVHFTRLVDIVKANRRPAQTCIFLLDCCHAGALSFDNVQIKVAGLQDAVVQAPGVILVAASEGDGEALESDKIKQGIFTYWLFYGLSGDAADTQGNVTALSLYSFIAKAISQFTSLQKPVLKTNIIGKDPVIGQGFKAQDNIMPAKLDEAKIFEIDSIQSSRINLIRRNIEADRETWWKQAYNQTCELLSELLEWRASIQRNYPEVRNHKSFTQYDNDVTQFQATLANIELGTRISKGVVSTQIGSGGFGQVFVVETESTLFAYKVYHAGQLFDKGKVRAFQRGFRSMKKLDHPNIIKAVESSEAPISFYMQYVDGLNFRSWWTDDIVKIMNVLHIVAQTLEYAHQQEVIHRDIKPENIIIEDNDSGTAVPYLTDFDLAWYSMASVFSSIGGAAAFGHYLYAAPEQYETPESDITKKPTTDIYGFGQLCYFAICGKDPARDSVLSTHALRERVQRWNSAEAARKFIEMYSRCIQRTPSERFQSMSDVSTTIIETRNLLIDPDHNVEISEDRFIRELVFSMFGFEINPTRIFNSRSGRTQVNISQLSNARIEIVFEAMREYTGLAGTYEQQKNSITRRIDNAISELEKQIGRPMYKHPDRYSRTYLTRIDMPGNYLTLLGTSWCKGIIQAVLDALESN